MYGGGPRRDREERWGNDNFSGSSVHRRVITGIAGGRLQFEDTMMQSPSKSYRLSGVDNGDLWCLPRPADLLGLPELLVP